MALHTFFSTIKIQWYLCKSWKQASFTTISISSTRLLSHRNKWKQPIAFCYPKWTIMLFWELTRQYKAKNESIDYFKFIINALIDLAILTYCYSGIVNLSWTKSLNPSNMYNYSNWSDFAIPTLGIDNYNKTFNRLLHVSWHCSKAQFEAEQKSWNTWEKITTASI